MSRLIRSAEFASTLHVRDQRRPSHLQAQKGLQKFQRALQQLRQAHDELGMEAREALRMALDRYRAEIIDVEEVIQLAEAAKQAQWSGYFHELMRPKGGRRHNHAAFIFVSRCAHIWREYTGRLPPKKCDTNSPFYKFVVAAMPRNVVPTPYFKDLTSTVNRALKRYHESPWSSTPTT